MENVRSELLIGWTLTGLMSILQKYKIKFNWIYFFSKNLVLKDYKYVETLLYQFVYKYFIIIFIYI